MDDNGWNFRTAQYHEQNRRTLFKAHGLKFLLNVKGQAGKFDLTKTIIIVVTGIGLMGLANILCDILVLNCSSTFRKEVMEKKYEAINPKRELTKKELTHMKNIVANSDITDDIKNSLLTISKLAVGPELKSSACIDEEDSAWV